jgi:serine/threonine-protein kinase
MTLPHRVALGLALGIALQFALTLTERTALAQPSAIDRAAAEALFNQALALMDAGNPTEACPKLEESQRLDPGVGTLLYLGACYEKLGRTASAWATFTDASYAAKDAGQTDRETVAKENAARLEASLSKLVIEVQAPDTKGLQVTRDGEAINPALWGSAMPVDPGTRNVEATAPGKQTWNGQIDVPAGPATVKLSIPPLEDAVVAPVAAPPPEPQPAARAAPPEPPPAATPRDGDPGKQQRLWGWIGIGGGGAIALGGGVFAVLAVSDNLRADDACRRSDPTLCGERGVTLGDSAHTKANVATALGGVGGALAVTGLVLLLTAPEADDSALLSLTPTWTASGAGVRLEGSY